VALSSRGIDGVYINGVKTWAELMEAYLVLLLRAAPADAAALTARAGALAEATNHPDFHLLHSMPDLEFKGNSMSYIRLMWVLEAFGFDSGRFRAAVQTNKPRLDAQLEQRGPWQREVFNIWYGYLGWEIPPVLTPPYHRSLGPIADRVPPGGIALPQQYELTHFVFVPTFYGYAPYADGHFDDAELAYLEATIPALLAAGVAAGEWDITSELISCMTYLGMTDDPALTAGVAALLDAQNPDGSFGDSMAVIAKHGAAVGEHAKLHPTLVALRALAEHFEPMPWNLAGPRRAEGPSAP